MPKLPRHVRYVASRDRYRAALDVAGKRVVGPLRQTAAEASADARRMAAQRRPTAARSVTLADCFTVLLAELREQNARPDTVTYYTAHWRIVTSERGWGPDATAHDVAPHEVADYVRARVDVDGVSLATAWDKEVGALRRALAAAVRAGLLRADPLDGLRRPKIRQGRFACLTVDEVHAIISRIRESSSGSPSVRERDALLVELFALTGMRRAEVARLTVGDCDLKTGRIWVDGKTGNRWLPMTDEIRRVVETLAGARDATHALVGSADLIERVFDRWRKRLGVPKLSPHVLRHSFATAAVAAGVDPFRLAALLGHRDIRQTQRYYHASDSAQREALASVMRRPGR